MNETNLSEIKLNIQTVINSLGEGYDYDFEIDNNVLKVKFVGTELEFNVDMDELDDLKNEILIRFKLIAIEEQFRGNEKEIELEFDRELWLRESDDSSWGVVVKCGSWIGEARILIDPEHLDQVETKIKRFLSLRYLEGEGCYCEDYLEFVITFEEWYLEYFKYKIVDTNNQTTDRIFYEVSPISDDLINVINTRESYDDEFFTPESLMTLKIKNINKNKKVSIDDKEYIESIRYIAKCIIFDITRKYSVNLKLDYANINPDVDPPEEIEDFVQQEVPSRRCILTNVYDKDLIEYYYVANQMAESEFKYLAYYRILECIFDEVYLYETTQDVKQIVTSNWFTPSSDQDIGSIIKIVEQYNKNKNDREKLKLVLERYFRGDNHDEAYFLANKEIIHILKDDIKKINKKEDIKDLQQFANILYDFRCNCAHSNRAFPAREVYEGTDSELQNYVNLIKKVSERLIVNYCS